MLERYKPVIMEVHINPTIEESGTVEYNAVMGRDPLGGYVLYSEVVEILETIANTIKREGLK